MEIRSQVTGIIKKIYFTERVDVQKNDRLYLIDPVPFRAIVASARGRVAQAVARLAQAKAELARIKPLLAEQAVSQKDVDDAVAEELAAKATLLTAKADWDKAQFDMTNTLVLAPVSGRIEQSQLYEGWLVSAQTDLLTSIYQMDPMYVHVNVPESYILRCQRELLAQRVKRPHLFELRGIMTMADGTTYPHEGKLDFAGTGFRSETGSLQARFVFPNTRQTMLPRRSGYSTDFCSVSWAIRQSPGERLCSPQYHFSSATGFSTGIPRVVRLWVGAEDICEIQPVQPSLWPNDQWVIEKGLKGGERIVVKSFHRVRPGIKVNSIPYSPSKLAATENS